MAKKLAILARREKQHRQEAEAAKRDLETREKAIAEREERAKADTDAKSRIQKLIVQDPAKALAEVAEFFQVAPQLLSYNALTKRQLNGADPSAELAGQASTEVAQLRAQLEEMKAASERTQQEAQARQAQEQRQQFISQARDYYSGNREIYPHLAAEAGDRGGDAVFRVIERHYVRTHEQTGKGQLLTPRKAADILEKKFAEKHKRLGVNLSGRTPGTQSRKQAPEATGDRAGASRTISNRQASEPSGEHVDLASMTRKERARYLGKKYNRLSEA